MKIADVSIGVRFRRDHGEIDSLARSISEIGLLHPIVTTPDGRLIAGERRLLAAIKLGWTEIPATVVDLEDIRRGERDENVIRKDFLPSEQWAIVEALTPVLRNEARERQGARTDLQPSAKLAESAGETRDRVAGYTGVGRTTLAKIGTVIEAAVRDPERYAPLVAEMDKSGRVNGVFKKLKTAEAAQVIRSEPQPLPTGPFRVIVADPPWPYESRAADPTHRAANPYPDMTLEDICNLPVEPMAAEESVLWLWTTNAFLRESFLVVRAWGYQYKTCLTWAKDRMGTGDWLRGQTEHCLMAVRGRPVVTLTNQTTLLRGPMREHSRKPDEFYAMVDALCPGSKLEMFSREPREGWVAWGAEPQKF